MRGGVEAGVRGGCGAGALWVRSRSVAPAGDSLAEVGLAKALGADLASHAIVTQSYHRLTD